MNASMTTGPPGPEFVYAVFVLTVMAFTLSTVGPHAPLAVIVAVSCGITLVVLYVGYST
jgi:hypothetical protein